MGTTTLLATAYSAVSNNEVGGQALVADSITAPSGSGTSGWTIGFNQQDFTAGTGIAQATLEAALEASGAFNSTNATNVATALTNAGTSTTVNFTGITATNGTVLSS